MRIKSIHLSISILFILFVWTGCGGSSNDTTTPTYTISSPTPTPGSPATEYINVSGNINYSINLGSSSWDVYFIFTNKNLNSDSAIPTVSPSIENHADEIADASESAYRSEIATPENNYSIISKPHISDFNRLLPGEVASTKVLSKSFETPPPSFDTVGDPVSFYDDTTSGTQIAATCRKVVTVGGKTLNIYVANDCWIIGGSGKTFYVTQAMVDALADKFLFSGLNNDIYDWVTNIYGAEWGAHSYPSTLISANNQITILLWDIDNDNTTGQGGAFVAGYFWARDNFVTASQPTSNQRIMFCIDAVLYANNNNTGQMTNDGSGWATTDYWPQQLIGTLAHEFQHMINYYQKTVLRNTSCDIWINEMCSLVTEDLLADKLNINGPRNVAYNDYSAGSANNQGGRLPLYNYWNDAPVNTWLDSPNTLISYSINYALGAYLARNFDGASLFKNMVQCNYGSHDAIEYALNQVSGNTDTTFITILKKWAVANLLSNRLDAGVHLKYNNDSSGFTDSMGYKLGSINLYNYNYSSLLGPYIYNNSTDPMSSKGTLYRSSNTYFRAAKNATGTRTWNINTPSGIETTVIMKPAE